MNTVIFNVFLAIFCLLYLTHILLWLRLKGNVTFRHTSESRLYTALAPAILAVCLVAVCALFILDYDAKFRLSLLIVLLLPLMNTHIRCIAMRNGLDAETAQGLKRRCELVRMTSLLAYVACIPMVIIFTC